MATQTKTPVRGARELEAFKVAAQNFASARASLLKVLEEVPQEEFGALVSPILEVTPDVLEKSHLLGALIREVAKRRDICTSCFVGTESNIGGRNGGEERYSCSNVSCISHKFFR